MKKFLLLVMAIIMALSLVACGGAEDPPINTDDSGNNQPITESTGSNDKKDEGNIAFTQDDKFPLPGYAVYCPDECYVSNSKYGRAFTYGNCSVILEAPSAVGNALVFNGFEDIVESCENYVCASLESRNMDIFGSGSTDQIVTEQKKITVNGIDALRVVGYFNNIRDNTETAYVAYYLVGGGYDGNIHPVYIVGISLNGDTTVLGDFMDQMASHIEKQN